MSVTSNLAWHIGVCVDFLVWMYISIEHNYRIHVGLPIDEVRGSDLTIECQGVKAHAVDPQSDASHSNTSCLIHDFK